MSYVYPSGVRRFRSEVLEFAGNIGVGVLGLVVLLSVAGAVRLLQFISTAAERRSHDSDILAKMGSGYRNIPTCRPALLNDHTPKVVLL